MHEYYIDESITRGEDGCVTMTNLSQNKIEVSENKIFARCVVCFEEKFCKNPLTALSTKTKASTYITENDLSLNPNLSSNEVKLIVDLINEFKICFTASNERLGKN